MENELLTQEQAARLFDAKLQELCAISVADAGLDQADVLLYAGRAKSLLQVKDAVLAFAADMDLDVRGTNWVA